METPGIIQLNIEHYGALLRLETDQAKQRRIADLLVEAVADLDRANRQRGPSDVSKAATVLREDLRASKMAAQTAADPATRQKLADAALFLAQIAEKLDRLAEARDDASDAAA